MGAVCSTWKMAASLPEACGRVSEKNENIRMLVQITRKRKIELVGQAYSDSSRHRFCHLGNVPISDT